MKGNSIHVESNVETCKGFARELQTCLEKGWSEFVRSPNMYQYVQFATFMRDAGFYESKLQGIVPHPAYDLGAREIGKYVTAACRRWGLHFDTFFPGEFSKSWEASVDGIETRQFTLDVFDRTARLCRLSIAFPHLHNGYGFPQPPIVRIDRVF